MELSPSMTVPLTVSEGEVIRIGDTRVRLDTVVYAFNEGYTAEEIVSQYPALDLGDVYAVIAYYLVNRPAVDEYMVKRVEKGQALRTEIEAKPEYQAFRQLLLKRREAFQSR